SRARLVGVLGGYRSITRLPGVLGWREGLACLACGCQRRRKKKSRERPLKKSVHRFSPAQSEHPTQSASNPAAVRDQSLVEPNPAVSVHKKSTGPARLRHMRPTGMDAGHRREGSDCGG